MGLTVLNIEVGNPARPEVTEGVGFLVDSGAIYSVVPSKILRKLGIKPLSKEEFRLANGERFFRKKGIALFKYGNKIGGADVIFGKKDDSTLLGAFTLEALGLTLDPLKRQLKPLPMIIATSQSESLRNSSVVRCPPTGGMPKATPTRRREALWRSAGRALISRIF